MNGLAEMPTDCCRRGTGATMRRYPQPDVRSRQGEAAARTGRLRRQSPAVVRAADHQQRGLRRPGDADPGRPAGDRRERQGHAARQATFLAPMFFTKGVDNSTWQAASSGTRSGTARHRSSGRPTTPAATSTSAVSTCPAGSRIRPAEADRQGEGRDRQDQGQGAVHADRAAARQGRHHRRICRGRTTCRHRQPASRTSTTLAAFEYPLQYVWVNDGK